jgi:uncharacterized protein YjgD (DUF1641 family)
LERNFLKSAIILSSGQFRRATPAPAEHIQALLAMYDILQGLHDRGVLDALNGVLSAGDFVLETVVETAETPETIRMIRNVMLLTRTLGSIEPELLKRVVDFVPHGVAKASAKQTEPLGLLSLVRKFNSKDSRRGLAVAAEILETFGRHLDDGASS